MQVQDVMSTGVVTARSTDTLRSAIINNAQPPLWSCTDH